MTSRSEGVLVPLPERVTFRDGFTTRKEWLELPDEAVIGKLIRGPAKTVVATVQR